MNKHNYVVQADYADLEIRELARLLSCGSDEDCVVILKSYGLSTEQITEIMESKVAPCPIS